MAEDTKRQSSAYIAGGILFGECLFGSESYMCGTYKCFRSPQLYVCVRIEMKRIPLIVLYAIPVCVFYCWLGSVRVIIAVSSV